MKPIVLIAQSTPMKIVFLALSYFVAGKLALLLAVPPGYATAIFPSAGIALAAVLLWGNRILPGVFLGSFLLNISVGYDPSSDPDFSILLSAVGIGFNAAIQAFVGAWLINRLLKSSLTLIGEREIALFLFLGGPVSCLINSTGSIGILYFLGAISADQVLFSWINWWVGDVIGVFITVPIMFTLFAKPRSLWKPRLASVTAPLVMSCSIIIIAFMQSSNWEQKNIQHEFRERADSMVNLIKLRIDIYINQLYSLERISVTTNQIERDEFSSYVDLTLRDFPGIRALEWLPRITNSQRKSFEESVQAEGFKQFKITEISGDKLIESDVRDEYFPVTFVEPINGNEKALGFDVYSEAVRKKALEAARDSGQAVMSSRVSLVQENSANSSFLVFYPVYEGKAEPRTVDERRERLIGFMVAVFRVSEFIQNSLINYTSSDFELQIFDITQQNFPKILYSSDSEESHRLEADFSASRTFEVGERVIQIKLFPKNSYVKKHRNLNSWFILAGGFLSYSVLGIFLLAMTGRQDRTRNLATQKTHELTAIFESAIESIMIFSEDGNIESANPSAMKLFDYPMEMLIKMDINKLVPGVNALMGKKCDDKACIDCDNNRICNTCETIGFKRDGSEIDIELGISLVNLPERTFYTVIIHDISERKKIDRLKSEFISVVSHELRTPVTSIKGSLGLITGGIAGEVPVEIKQLVAIAKENSDRLVNLINDILDIENLEVGNMAFDFKNHRVSALILKSIVQNQSYADSFHVNLVFVGEESMLHETFVNVDSDRFLQVMSNLISNAVKFSTPNEKVEIQATKNKNILEIGIQDYGEGIPESFHDMIFHKFSQADTSDKRKPGGTGLGLIITKMIVEKMGGKINFRSQTGKGSVFYFSLPIVDNDT